MCILFIYICIWYKLCLLPRSNAEHLQTLLHLLRVFAGMYFSPVVGLCANTAAEFVDKVRNRIPNIILLICVLFTCSYLQYVSILINKVSFQMPQLVNSLLRCVYIVLLTKGAQIPGTKVDRATKFLYTCA
jgi:hypothetical protein